MKRITFEDHNQDFLTWDIDGEGNIVDSQPFQASIWTKYKVLDHEKIKEGGKVRIIKHSARSKEPQPQPLTIVYPIETIELLAETAPES